MAGDVGDSCRSLDDRIAKEVQEELGILAVSRQQRTVDYLGPAGWRLRADSLAAMPGLFEYQGRGEESLTGNLVPVI